ncbi:flavodoxin family protein [Oceanobacillus piezotolerans]|uniref:Flavodoxin family protein n=1 Tax=Oceanobacillus piezotolerans TaxID=2448030 RepID=A0A498D6W0_9BACI|nr:flavodoxin family protein [Oceanobacillus piezotolerans]RLL45488.1 flavodoxin family protein [Oceanobacillus piezotolerans]
MSTIIIYGGTRENGNTEILTELAVKGLDVERIFLKDFKVRPIEDLRHTAEGFYDMGDDYSWIIEQIQKHEVILFATPIYWYSMSGIMKNFIDRWSQSLKETNGDFKREMSLKQAYVIGVGGDEPHIKGLPMIQQFNHIFNFIGIPFEGYILGQANKPGEIVHDKKAIEAAGLLLEELRGYSYIEQEQ